MCIFDNVCCCTFGRDAGNGLHVVRFDLNMNSDLLVNTMVQYKYIIFSNLFDELNDPYELLYGVPYTHAFDMVNRCLLVPRDKCHPKGMQKFLVV